MPQLSDLISKRPDKKFIKKKYRPWDLSGTGTIDNSTDIIEATSASAEEINSTLESAPEGIIKSVNSGNVTDNTPGNNQVTNRAINNNIDNKQVTNKKRIDNAKDNELDNSIDNVSDNKENTIFLTDSIRKLSGIQKKIFFYVIDLCSYQGQLQSNPILTIDLAKVSNCSFGSAKTSLIRLINKKLLIRKKGQASKGGHIILAITKEIQTAALHARQFNLNAHKDLHSGNVMSNISDNRLDNIIDNNQLTSSSNIYINTTTNTEVDLPEDWLEINLEPLSEIKFTIKQLKQLYKLKITTPEIVQESINHFAFGLKNNLKFKNYNDPLNVLMGVLRKGDVWIETNYESPQVIAQRKILERIKIEQEVKKQLEEDAFKLGLADWQQSLSLEELEKITAKEVGDLTPKSVKISKYFKEHVWSGVKKDYLLDGIE